MRRRLEEIRNSGILNTENESVFRDYATMPKQNSQFEIRTDVEISYFKRL